MSTATLPEARSSVRGSRSVVWLNVSSHLDPQFGGIAKVLPEFCAALNASGELTAPLIGFCDGKESAAADASAGLEVHCIAPGSLPGPLAAAFGPNYRALLERVRGAEGIHIHGIWEQHCALAVKAAKAAHRPYLISAHGMLEPWALRNKRVKKALYSWITERANVSGAACLVALTHAEAMNYRAFGARSPIAVIPNGVRVPSSVTTTAFYRAFPALSQRRCVLFLGRIHHKKGLALLTQAWKQVAESEPDAHLVLAGPDCEGTRAKVEQQIDEMGLRDRVTFTGMLSGELKWSALRACELFVLPSYSEGFSVSVIEAMGMGKPVIVTKQCNVPEVSIHGCGWVIDPNVSQLSSSILESLRMPSASARSLGENGRLLAERSYNWKSVSQKVREVYQWVSGGRIPQSVELLR